MSTPCGKCGSKATYSNEHWGGSGRMIEVGCLMCGWRQGCAAQAGNVRVVKDVCKRQSALTRRGYCANCQRDDVVLITASMCSACYKWRKDEAALAACAERLRREIENGVVHHRRRRILPGGSTHCMVHDGGSRGSR